ncbi:hypothetical protein ABKV19_014508 [Rosa sericea]
MVKFMLEHLEKSGCGILDGSCWAIHCEKKIAGVYTRRGWIRAGHLSGDCHCKREFLLCQEDSRIVNKEEATVKRKREKRTGKQEKEERRRRREAIVCDGILYRFTAIVLLSVD